jgi:predicted acylesterase/phospholipase RssA
VDKNIDVAWIFSGGAGHGAWQLAACKRYLMDNPNEKPDLVAGVSVGAINGAMVVQADDPMQGVERGLDVWKGVKGWWSIYRPDWRTFTALFSFMSGIKFLRPLFTEGLFHTRPLRKLIEKNVNKKKIQELGRKFVVGAVNMSTGKYKRFDETEENLVDAIMASSAFPWLFRPITIDGEPYFDGGLRNKTPFRSANMFHPKKIVVFIAGSINSLGYVHPENFAGMYNALERIFAILFDEAWRDDLHACLAGDTEVVIVCRKDSIPYSALSFNGKDIHSMIEEVLEPRAPALDLYQVLNGKEAIKLLKPTEEGKLLQEENAFQK